MNTMTSHEGAVKALFFGALWAEPVTAISDEPDWEDLVFGHEIGEYSPEIPSFFIPSGTLAVQTATLEWLPNELRGILNPLDGTSLTAATAWRSAREAPLIWPEGVEQDLILADPLRERHRVRIKVHSLGRARSEFVLSEAEWEQLRL